MESTFIFLLSHCSSFAVMQVLRIHPSLAPIKVAVDLGKGPAAELRLVCIP